MQPHLCVLCGLEVGKLTVGLTLSGAPAHSVVQKTQETTVEGLCKDF